MLSMNAMKPLSKLLAWMTAEISGAANALPSREKSAWFDQECVKCGAEFDVPPDVVFDQRRAHYCEDCLPCP